MVLEIESLEKTNSKIPHMASPLHFQMVYIPSLRL